MEAITTAPDSGVKQKLNEVFKTAKIHFMDEAQSRVKINYYAELSHAQLTALMDIGEITVKRSGTGLVISLTVV